ncbi:uncharacterized protein EI90DRAFT_3127654 [Cantharellus anzutake]|uniref:uncharacterized protein n=1 Tax=Cantharellus anzutake TaxID=1750568 RepID=UPI001906AA91|nr:uncharacterized protein EI90DRAFT_3127654 [Cantharellus anzutake]KAF8326848.1 hypothetical protein EI90DRAFT_3127654 [Cantharellus anzutake]
MTLSLCTLLIFLASTAFAQTPNPTSSTSIPPVSLYSTNPTAVPLSSITSGVPSQSTIPLSPSPTPGATPPVKGAPPLPSFVFSPSLGYPPLDLVPSVNSSQVQQWIQDVKNSGVKIPNLSPTLLGGCATNPTLITNTSRCWWTCGGCTRSTDIVTCPDKLTWGLSYDDGPSPWSPDLLDYLNTNNLHTTYFIIGSRAISRPDILQAEYMSGHQISVHTWSHPYMTTLSNEQIIAELGWAKKAIKDITGVTPNTWRPPFGDVDDRVRALAQAMGLTTIVWSAYNGKDFDSNDWFIPAGYPVAQVIDNFENILSDAQNLSTGFIALEHDLYQQTVDLAIGYILPYVRELLIANFAFWTNRRTSLTRFKFTRDDSSDALARKTFNLKSIISCLHKPLEDAYIETNNNTTNPTSDGATTLPASTSSGTTVAGKGSSSTPAGHGGAGFVGATVDMSGVVGLCVILLAVMFGGVMVF